MFSASDKAKVFAEIFSKNSNLGESGIFLPSIPFATNFKLLNIAATLKLFRKVIIYFDFWMASGPDCIPVVVLKNCEPELCILAKYFNMSPNGSCFQIVGNSHLWSLYLIKLEKGLGPKIIPLLVFFSSFVKSLENLWMIGLLITLKNVQIWVPDSHATADLLTVVSNRIARSFNASGATWTVAFDIFKAFARFWQAYLLHKLMSYWISCWVLRHILFISQ